MLCLECRGGHEELVVLDCRVAYIVSDVSGRSGPIIRESAYLQGSGLTATRTERKREESVAVV